MLGFTKDNLASSRQAPAISFWYLVSVPVAAYAVWFALFAFVRLSLQAWTVVNGGSLQAEFWALPSVHFIATGVLALLFPTMFRIMSGGDEGRLVANFRAPARTILLGAVSAGIALALFVWFAVPHASGIRTARLTPSTPDDVVAKILLIAVYGVVVPIAEELYFRALVLSWLRQWFSPVISATLAAAAFALAHGRFAFGVSGMATTVVLAVLGLVCAYFAIKTMSLWPAIVAHSGYNVAIAILSFLPG